MKTKDFADLIKAAICNLVTKGLFVAPVIFAVHATADECLAILCDPGDDPNGCDWFRPEFVFDPPPGAYSSAKEVIIRYNDPTAIIRYTTDGREPTDADPVFTTNQPIHIDGFTTITVRGCGSIYGAQIQSAIYSFLVDGVFATPSSGSVTNGARISVHSATSGAALEISHSSLPAYLVSEWEAFDGTIRVTSNTTFHVRASKDGYWPAMKTFTYTLERLPRLDFFPTNGPITNGAMVTITSSIPNVTIRYTLDGTDPNEEATEYTQPIQMNPGIRLKARSYKDGYLPSFIRYTYYRSMSPNPQPYATNSWDLPHLKLTYVTGADRPVWGTHAGDGTGRFFVVEETGNIRIVGNSTPFLQTELSLINVAFPPDYDSKAYFYVSYHAEGGRIAVARYSALANPDTADPNSQEVITNLPLTECRGGQLVFAPDGTLYLNSGGPIANAVLPEFNQDLNVLSGKMIPILNENGAALPAPADGTCWPFEAYFSPTNCSIVGGVFARTTDSRLAGTYLYANGNGRVWAITRGNGVGENQFLARFEIMTTVRRNTFQSASWEEMRPVDVSSLGEDEDGHIYLIHYGTLVTNYHLQPPEIRYTLEGGGIYRLDDNLDVFSVRAVGGVNGHPLTLEWFSASGRSYQIQQSFNLQDWVNVLEPVTGNGGPVSIQLPPQSPASGHYYRVNLLPQ